MGVRFYDKALLDKLKNWVKDPNLTILGPGEINRTFQIISDVNNDKEIRLPLIILSRNGTINIENISKRPLTFDGSKLLYSNDKSKSVKLNAIPIELNYQIDVVTRYYAEADEYIRNFVFNLINYPKLSITIPYNDMNYVHNSNIILDPAIVDNSDNPQRLFQGQLSDWSIKFKIDDAYLFSVPFNRTWSLESPAELVIKDGDNITTEYVTYDDYKKGE